MKVLAIILNFFFPGVGSLVIGKTGVGIAQLALSFMGLVLFVTVLGAIIGGPMMFIAWVWGLVVAAQYQEEPKVVHVIQQPPTAPVTPEV